MSEQIKLIAKRLRELREIENISIEEICTKLDVDAQTYSEYESGQSDIPVSFLYNLASVFKIELTALLTGKEPHLNIYSVVRNGEGLDVERSKQYKYKNLAYKMLNKKAEPFLVVVDPIEDDKLVPLNAHDGQEIDYVLEGSVCVHVGEYQIVLNEGDTIYYNSKYPHGMRALGGKQAKFLAVIIN